MRSNRSVDSAVTTTYGWLPTYRVKVNKSVTEAKPGSFQHRLSKVARSAPFTSARPGAAMRFASRVDVHTNPESKDALSTIHFKRRAARRERHW